MAQVSALEHTGIGAFAGVLEVSIMQARWSQSRVPLEGGRRQDTLLGVACSWVLSKEPRLPPPAAHRGYKECFARRKTCAKNHRWALSRPAGAQVAVEYNVMSAACCRRLLSACRKSAIADATALQERLDMQYISSTVRMANVISPSRNQTELPFVAP